MEKTYANSFGLRADWAKGKSAARILSALGHPGYGTKFAKRVLDYVDSGHGTHDAVARVQHEWNGER